MTSGKDICNELKALRRRIADENQIPLETEECTYKGECCGTCPRCDADVRYLEDALSHRLSLGKAATVAGLALGLAVGTGIQAQNTTDTTAQKPLAKEIADTVGKVRVTGVVLNSKTKEPEPFINVTVEKDGKLIGGAATDIDGKYVLYIPKGEYKFIINGIGFKRMEFLRTIGESDEGGVLLVDKIYLEERATMGLLHVVIKGDAEPKRPKLIDKDPYGPKGHVEYDGVKVIVK